MSDNVPDDDDFIMVRFEFPLPRGKKISEVGEVLIKLGQTMAEAEGEPNGSEILTTEVGYGSASIMPGEGMLPFFMTAHDFVDVEIDRMHEIYRAVDRMRQAGEV